MQIIVCICKNMVLAVPTEAVGSLKMNNLPCMRIAVDALSRHTDVYIFIKRARPPCTHARQYGGDPDLNFLSVAALMTLCKNVLEGPKEASCSKIRRLMYCKFALPLGI